MKILHVCPLWFPITRDAPGGIETLLWGLIGALERGGCRCTVLASADSELSAELVPVVEHNLYRQMEEGMAWEYAYYEQHLLLEALKREGSFDVVHSHVGAVAYALSGVPGLGHRVLHTIHGPITADLRWFVRQNPRLWLSTVSEFQADRLRRETGAPCEAIHNGIDFDQFTLDTSGGERLLFVGRIEREKGPDLAVRTARELDLPLTLAGPIVNGDFFATAVEPLLDERVRYLGVVDHLEKNQLFGSSSCLLMPSRWEEPFGVVALEAMACGTPVVGLSNGALPEIVEDGTTGFLTSNEADLPALVSKARGLDRARVRSRAAERFEIAVVADRYRRLYRRVLDGGPGFVREGTYAPANPR